jgi:hypothetical protein
VDYLNRSASVDTRRHFVDLLVMNKKNKLATLINGKSERKPPIADTSHSNREILVDDRSGGQ